MTLPAPLLDRLRAFVVKSAYRRKPKEALEFDAADRAAIALSRAGLRPAPSADMPVLFMISLVDRSRSRDWTNVCDNLDRTLRSLSLQTDPNWVAIVCCGDRPGRLPVSDRVIFLAHDRDRFPQTDEIERGAGDKGAKREQIIAFIETTYTCDGYAFAMDGDDLLHRDLVAYMRSARDPNGYIIERGLKVDLQTGGMEELGPRGLSGTRLTPMWSTCGTGTGLYFDLRSADGIGTALIRTALLHNHRRGPILAALAGRPPRRIPFHAGVYLVNNGGNVTEWRVGRETGARNAKLAGILEDGFAWSDLHPPRRDG